MRPTLESTDLELTDAHWRKSSYSNTNGGDCLEVAHGVSGKVPVRDSTRRGLSSAVVMPVRAWHTFVSAVKDARL